MSTASKIEASLSDVSVELRWKKMCEVVYPLNVIKCISELSTTYTARLPSVSKQSFSQFEISQKSLFILRRQSSVNPKSGISYNWKAHWSVFTNALSTTALRPFPANKYFTFGTLVDNLFHFLSNTIENTSPGLQNEALRIACNPCNLHPTLACDSQISRKSIPRPFAKAHYLFEFQYYLQPFRSNCRSRICHLSRCLQ